MRTNREGIELIKQFEGFRASPYTCSAGKSTIGYGHVILPHETFPEPLTESQAEDLLKIDLIEREKTVRESVYAAKIKLSQNMFSALVSFVYNVGSKAFRNSTLLRYVIAGIVYSASDEFLKWTKFRDPITKKVVGSPGLLNRRKAERELFLKGNEDV